MIATQFKRMPLGALAIASVATLGAAPFVLTSLASQGYAVPQFSAAQRLMAMLDARSPGERAKGELSATKIKKIANAVHPTQRALGKIVRAAPPPVPAEFIKAITPAAPPVALAPPIGVVTLADVIPKVTAASAPGGGGGVVLPTIIGGGGGGGGGGSGGGGGTPGAPTTTPQPPTAVTSAVPEPATWMTMLVGFGAIGIGMRRRRAPARAAAKAA